MKKIVFSLLFLIGMLTFANKGNYDETKFRQDIINYAMNNLGKPYSNDYRMRDGYFDCSSYIGKAVRAAGMKGGVNGNEGNWASTTDSMIRNVKKVPFNQIKPGDTLNFSKGSYKYGHTAMVLENLGNGKFKIAHAGNPTKVQTIDANTWRKGTYIGSISATQILINNGYTPVNSSGQVLTPPTGISSGSGSGSITPPSYIRNSIVKHNWDTISNKITNLIKIGIKNILPDIKILLGIFFSFDLMYFFYKGYSGLNENFIAAFARKCLKFMFYLAVLDNYFKILEWAYNFFISLGEHFYSGEDGLLRIFDIKDDVNAINKIADMGFTTVVKFLDLVNEWEHLGIFGLDVFGKLKTLGNLFTILVMIGFSIYITARIIIEIYIAKTQFFLGSGLCAFFIPCDVFELTSRVLGNKALKTIIATGLQITVLMIIASIGYEILQNYTLEEINLKDKFDLYDIFRFITVNLIIVNLIAKGKNMIGYVMR